MNGFISKAHWPMGGYVTTTEVKHATEPQAQAVCDLLEKEGYGGEGQLFPIKTEVLEDE